MGMLQGGLLSQAAAGGGGGLVTTINSARSAIIKSVKKGTKVVDLIYAWGFDAGSDTYFLSNFGSIADGTYDDGGSNSRVVDSCYWVSNDNDQTQYLQLHFVLDTTSVPNTDTTFVSIIIDGTTFNRSAASYTASVNGGTRWRWSSVSTDPFSGANPDDFEVTI